MDSLRELLGSVDVIGVDMPIGLPDGPRRASDAAARAFLGPRRSSVFPTPSRAIIGSVTHTAANELSRSLHGIGVSAQSFNLFPKIREIDALARGLDVDERNRRLVEVHPECSFRAMTGDVRPPKKTPSGARARRDAVRSAFGITVGSAPRGAGLDDALDAYAVLWTAERFARGEHEVLPETDVEQDSFGTLMRIVV